MQKVVIDLVVRSAWTDKSMAAESGETLNMDSKKLWTPRLQVVGNKGMREITGDWVAVRPDGKAEQRTRYVGSLSSRMNLTDFPLDQQIVKIELVAGSREPVELEIDQSSTGKASTLTVADWEVGEGNAYNSTYKIVDRELPSAVYEIAVTRYFAFYLWKVIVPLALIVFMSWTVFWIDPSAFGPQIGAATASMLTLIAYRFALGNLVPKISYFTRMDIFITGATIMVFFALLQAIVTSRLAAGNKPVLAQKMDDVCRWFFPLVFVCLVAYSFVA